MRIWPGLLATAALALTGACGGSDDDGGGDAVPRRPGQTLEVVREDLTWTTPAGHEWELDVLHPVDEGPWPVMVSFHGAAGGTGISAQRAVAEGGVVVVAPRWIEPAWTATNLAVLDAGEYVDGGFFDIAPCALAGAQAIAADYGGDVGITIVQGFSAGVHPASWAAFGVARDDLCPGAIPVRPVGLDLGDLQFVFQAEHWDDAFANEDNRAPDTVGRLLDPGRWDLAAGFTASLWSTESTVWQRALDPDLPADSWLWPRIDEDIADDLREVGALDDGAIGFGDNGRLLELRMQEAGIDGTHVQYGGEHRPRPEGSAEALLDMIWRHAT